jgi:hypothetical protein
MTLWTIQPVGAWTALKRRGNLRGDARRVEKSYRPAYEWMAKQMEQRIGLPPTENAQPIWAWYRWRGEQQRKPDLRSGAHLDRGQTGIRLELDVEERRVLLSDFDLWHFVLNYWYLPASEKEGDAFEAELAAKGLSFFEIKPVPIERYHQAIEASWSRIFDLDFIAEGIVSPQQQKCQQACLWEIEPADVTDVKEFTAR